MQFAKKLIRGNIVRRRTGRERAIMKKSTLKLILVAMFMLLAISGISTAIDPSASFAQAATPGTIVTTELINYYSMTNSEVQTFMTILHNQGITALTVRINSYSEWTGNSNTAIAKIKAIIPVANAQGISINVDLHTWFTTWDNSFRDSASNSAANRNTYINYVETTLQAFNGYNVNTFMVLNEPQARKASTSENNFILSIISAANSVTNRPISVRFMAGYSPTTGHYSPAIDQATDFLCRNSYWDARNPSVSVYGCTETKLLTALSTAHSQNKQLWITEFGKSNSNLADQQSYVKAFVAYAKSKEMDQIFCWVSQPESSGESYNIFNGYTPNPAFYELVNTGAANPFPSPSPTPTSTPTPTQTPQPTSTPTPSPKPSPTLSPTPTPTSAPSPNVVFADNFESQNFNQWTNTEISSGETASVVRWNFNSGLYSAKFTSNGGANTEDAYVSKTIGESEVYARAYFYVANGLPLADNSDRFYLTELMAGTQYLAGVGIRHNNGVDKWVLYARSGSSWIGPYYVSTSTVAEGHWYCVELHWKQSSSGGVVELFINGAMVQQITGLNTGTYGKATSAIFGLSSATGVQNKLEIYADSCTISRSYVGP